MRRYTLAQQSLSLFLAVIPALRSALTPLLPAPRHALLLHELDRAGSVTYWEEHLIARHSLEETRV